MFRPSHEIKKKSNTTVFKLQNTSKDMKSTTIQVVTKCEPIVKGPFLMEFSFISLAAILKDYFVTRIMTFCKY